MKNWAKNILSIFVIVTMLIGTSTPINAYANETYRYDDWEYIVVDGNIAITKYVGSETSITVPARIDDKKVTTIKFYTFKFCDSLENITISENISNIECSFGYCSGLSSINVVSDNKFFSSRDGVLYNKNQSSLLAYPSAKESDNFIVPDSVKKIGETAFAYSTGLKGITIPENVTAIGECAFYECTKLRDVRLPNIITVIEKGTFYNCKSLINITIPESVTYIGTFAFECCYGLSSITIPPNVKIIADRAFSTCIALKNVNLSKGLLEIGYASFRNCESLVNIAIPESVNKMGAGAFEFCENLNSITIPENVTAIGECAFYKCINLKTVNLSENLSIIGYKCFSKCTKLESIVIQSTVTTIGDEAFMLCENLKTVKFMGKKPVDMGDNIFDGCSPELTILYPQKYESSWSDYTDYPKIAHNDIETPVLKISLKRKKAILSKGKKYRLKCRITPVDADLQTVRWKSSNKRIATVSGKGIVGIVKARRVGTCTITAITKDGHKKARCEIRVVLPVEKIRISAKQISIKKGSKHTLKASVKPKNATIKKVVWSSSNEKIAKVSKGVVTGIKRGKCYVTAKSKNGNKKARCKVLVK